MVLGELPHLLELTPPAHHKWVIGYSDITSLHLFLSQQWGWKSIHGAVFKEITDFNKDIKNFEYLEQILSGKLSCLSYSGLQCLNDKCHKKTAGKLTGGNASLLSVSIGTSWQIDAKNKIVIIEDSGHGLRIDRVLQHLKNTNILNEVAAIIIGDIISWDTNPESLIADFLKDLRVPVFKADFFGHGAKNYPWVYNADAERV
jgi:muramoyltetrapeptide carboxypeptidase